MLQQSLFYFLCHSTDNKIKSQCSLYHRSKAIMLLTRENVGAKLIQQFMKENISSVKWKIRTSKDKGLMMCWLYIILFVRYTDVKCCKEKHNRVQTIVSRGAVAREAYSQSCYHLYTEVRRTKKSYAEECVSNCPESEYSETENIVRQGMFAFTRFAFASLLAQK